MVATNNQKARLLDLTVPAVGEEFELTLNGDEVDPLDMVRRDGEDDWEHWRFNGPRVTGTHTRRFKLVCPGYCRDLAEVKQKAGKLAEGQWREAFRQKYPNPDGLGPIGFGGSEWLDPDSHRHFPYLGANIQPWHSYFPWDLYGFAEHWRWLVEVGK